MPPTTLTHPQQAMFDEIAMFAMYRGIRVEVRKIADGTAVVYPNTGNPMRDLYCNAVSVPVAELEKVTE